MSWGNLDHRSGAKSRSVIHRNRVGGTKAYKSSMRAASFRKACFVAQIEENLILFGRHGRIGKLEKLEPWQDDYRMIHTLI